MEQIKDVDEFIAHAGIHRIDGGVTGPEDDFELEAVLFDPDQAQVFRSRYPKLHIWTMVSGDEGDYLEAGVHYVNRLGYMFTDIDPKDPRLAGHVYLDCTILTWFENEPAEVA